MIPYEDTGYVLGFLLIDISPPNLSWIEQRIERKGV